MHNLEQLTEQIRNKYSTMLSYTIPTNSIKMVDAGHLYTEKNEFVLQNQVLEQLAEIARIPTHFFMRIPTDMQTTIFNRCFQMARDEGYISDDIVVHLNSNKEVIGLDKPDLMRISPVKLMDAITNSLPQELSAKNVKIASFDSTLRLVKLSCFSPTVASEPRPGDIINGGIDVVHYLSGDAGTQISCYLRRLVCCNGAITHVCGEDKHLRARRLRNGRFDEADMVNQICKVLSQAWSQLEEKLNAVKGLLEKSRVGMNFIRQQRTRFSLNNRILDAIEEAIYHDEIGPTNSQYDIFNALSRTATHLNSLTFRQQRTLSRMAGEVTQQSVHKCDRCGQWIIEEE